LKLLHRVVVDSSRSCHTAIAYLSTAAMSSKTDAARAAPNWHARAGACERNLIGPSLHSW
jgi:hypothetical protein